MPEWGFTTRAIHVGQEPEEKTGAVITPIYQTSTFAQDDLGVHKGYDYSRSINPTREVVETVLASLENARYGLAFASGMAAETAIMHLLESRDHVVAGDDLYGGTFRLFSRVMEKYGLEFSYVDPANLEALSNAMRPETRVVWMETPTNPLLKVADIAAVVRNMIAGCDVPVLVDIDDGYGDVKNAVHTVQTYERMGVSASLIEDQQWPKRCGHMVGKKVVPIELAEAKIKAAASERINPETWILGRTDARAVYDLDEAMRRAERYIRAGADGIFIEAPRSVAELERIGKAFDVPQICNPLMGGHTPILSMEELGQLGFNCAVLGLDTIMHAAKAIEAVLVDMKSGKFAHRNDGMDFEDYKKLVGYDKWESVDERFAPKQ